MGFVLRERRSLVTLESELFRRRMSQADYLAGEGTVKIAGSDRLFVREIYLRRLRLVKGVWLAGVCVLGGKFSLFDRNFRGVRMRVKSISWVRSSSCTLGFWGVV